MAFTIQQAYDLGASAARLVSKAFARTLTNNPAAQIETDLETAAADTVAKAIGSTSAVVNNAQVLAAVGNVNGTTQLWHYTLYVQNGVLTRIDVTT